MADEESDRNVQPVQPPKRRRVLDPSAVIPVSVYSSKVSSCLQMKPTALFTDKENPNDDLDESLWSGFFSRTSAGLSDSEDEADPHHSSENRVEDPSPHPPPPPESPVRKQSRKATKNINEINKRLRAMSSIMSPEPLRRPSKRCKASSSVQPDLDHENVDDDVIIMSPDTQKSYSSDSVREIPLKVRCRADVYKIPVLSSAPLTDVVSQLSVILKVPPTSLLLLRHDIELPSDSSVGELGLSIADIIECVVMRAEAQSSSSVTVRLQSKDRDSSQEYSIHRVGSLPLSFMASMFWVSRKRVTFGLFQDTPLDTIFSQYLSSLPSTTQRKVRFHFDGSKVISGQTPAQLDMEDGDIIEVWI
uniref:NFATC2-interacting protein n=1 Tax=Nothobranchius kuhntae TaxID=321403 RepID=A0A1A8J3A1_NOTKU